MHVYALFAPLFHSLLPVRYRSYNNYCLSSNIIYNEFLLLTLKKLSRGAGCGICVERGKKPASISYVVHVCALPIRDKRDGKSEDGRTVYKVEEHLPLVSSRSRLIF